MDNPEAETPSPAPRLNKWPFVIGDLLLVAGALALGAFSEKPLNIWVVALALLAIITGALLLAAPFVIEHMLRLNAELGQKNLQIASIRSAVEKNTEEWERLGKDIQRVFGSTQVNLAGYEGILHRYDNRLGSLEETIDSLRKAAASFAETTSDASSQWDTQRTALKSIQVELRDQLQQSAGSNDTPTMDLSKVEERLQKIEAAIADLGIAVTEQVDADDFDWHDPSGEHASMLDKALDSNSAPMTSNIFGLGGSEEADPREEESADNVPADGEADDPDEFIPEGFEAEIEDDDWIEEDDPFDDQPESTETLDEDATGEVLDFLDGVSQMPDRDTMDKINSLVEDTLGPTNTGEPRPQIGATPFPGPDTEATPEAPPSKPAEPATQLEPDTFPQSATLTAHILLSIGDQLMLRGDAPGLSPEVGTPIDLDGIGVYRWEVTYMTAPATVQFWLNDTSEALGDPIEIRPGDQLDVTPDFP